MRAMGAAKFSGCEGLKLVDLPKPPVSDGKVFRRMTAAASRPSVIRFSQSIPPRAGAASPREGTELFVDGGSAQV
jgi:NADPH2:quinone reductase